MKVLLADSSTSVRQVVELALKDEDAQLAAVADGMEALAKAEEMRPDLVLADIELPSIDGYSLCGRLKENPALSHTRIFLLKPEFASYDEQRAESAGADGLLEKPFGAPALLELLGEGVEGIAEPAQEAPVKAETGGEPASKEDAVFELMESAVVAESDSGEENSSFDMMEKALMEEGAVEEGEPLTYEIDLTNEDIADSSELFVMAGDRENGGETPESEESEEPYAAAEPEPVERRETAPDEEPAPKSLYIDLTDEISFADLKIGDDQYAGIGGDAPEEEPPDQELVAEESPISAEEAAPFEEAVAEPVETDDLEDMASGEETDEAVEAGEDYLEPESVSAEGEEIEPLESAADLGVGEIGPAPEVEETEFEEEPVMSATTGLPPESEAPEDAESDFFGEDAEPEELQPLDLAVTEEEPDAVESEREVLGLVATPTTEAPLTSDEEAMPTSGLSPENAEELIEQVTRRVLERLGALRISETDEKTAARAEEELLGEIVRRLSDQVVQEVAWEVVPELAERIIRNAIDEIKQIS